MMVFMSESTLTPLSELDKKLINLLQDGFPLTSRPFITVSKQLAENGVEASEADVMQRIQALLDDGTLSRFGPMYQAERMGGGLTLAAMKVDEKDYERVNEQVNAFAQVAHNYRREHELTMWFVLATETPEGIKDCIAEMEAVTGYHVFDMPKEEEFYVGLKFAL
jgi:DNA-binding Lrp family transcriptional regulator